jgi:GNAT superfamily N-acetyltransferase
VLIRAARADDRERLITAFQGLDRQTIYTRYFSFRKSLSETELKRLEEADSCRYILLVATRGSGTDETIIAGASCVVTEATGPVPTAEVAFMVEEDYQRLGLAGQLLAAICGLARQRGIARLEADVLAENPAMLAVFRRSGLPTTTSRSGGVVHLVMDLSAPAPGASAEAKS